MAKAIALLLAPTNAVGNNFCRIMLCPRLRYLIALFCYHKFAVSCGVLCK